MRLSVKWMYFVLLNTKCKTCDWFSQRVTFQKKKREKREKKKTHRQAQPQPCRHKNMYLSTTVAHCIHMLLPHNLDRGVWRDLIIAHKATLLKAGINYRDLFFLRQYHTELSKYILSSHQWNSSCRQGKTKLCPSKKNGIFKNVILVVSAVSEAWSLGRR